MVRVGWRKAAPFCRRCLVAAAGSVCVRPRDSRRGRKKGAKVVGRQPTIPHSRVSWACLVDACFHAQLCSLLFLLWQQTIRVFIFYDLFTGEAGGQGVRRASAGRQQSTPVLVQASQSNVGGERPGGKPRQQASTKGRGPRYDMCMILVLRILSYHVNKYRYCGTCLMFYAWMRRDHPEIVCAS